jgi:hypothetical protein
MHRQIRRALGAIGALLLTAPSAGAYSVGLTWIDTDGAGLTGSDSIAAGPGDQITLQIEFFPEDIEVAAFQLSADFDLDGGNELDLVSCTTTVLHIDSASGAIYTPVTPCGGNPGPGNGVANVESQIGTGGQANGMNLFASLFGPHQSSGSILLGEITFAVNQPLTDGADIHVGSLRETFDGVTGRPPGAEHWDTYLWPRVVLGTASVIANPEPGTAALLGLGLIGLGAARRRRRR